MQTLLVVVFFVKAYTCIACVHCWEYDTGSEGPCHLHLAYRSSSTMYLPNELISSYKCAFT